MSVITIIILSFSLLGALDKICGDRFGIGKEFEKAFSLFCPMALSMLGILVLAPAIGVWLKPAFEWFYSAFGIDPSIIPASLFANDMGGITLSTEVCKSKEIGDFSAFIISSMFGCAISFTIPFSVGIVKSEQHKELFFGLLCGLVTVPIGCVVSGLICGLNISDIVITLLPLIIISVIISLGLIFVPKICIKAFWFFGQGIRIVAILGLAFALFTFLSKVEINKNFDTLENAAFICVNACVTLSGALPLMFVVTKIIKKPLDKFGSKVGIDSTSAVCFLSSTVTNAPTFSLMEKMNKKGVVLNSAFAVSAAFTFGAHLAITSAYNPSYVVPMMAGKLISGICSVILALLIYKEDKKANNK